MAKIFLVENKLYHLTSTQRILKYAVFKLLSIKLLYFLQGYGHLFSFPKKQKEALQPP